MTVLEQPTDDVDGKLSTNTYPDQGQPAWRVAGPAGSVVYRSYDHRLIVQPEGLSGEFLPAEHAAEARRVATTKGDLGMYLLLAAHYNTMATEHAGRPRTVADWRQLHPDGVADAILNVDWYAWPDDTAGGWAIMPINVPPSSAVPTVGWFLGERTARHIAKVHNEALAAARTAEQNRVELDAVLAAQRTKIAPVRDVVRKGDLVFVPKGADRMYDINRRFRVDDMTSYGVSGSRIKTDGTPMKSTSSTAADEHGNVSAIVTWNELLKCTITRDGQTVYSPEGQQ